MATPSLWSSALFVARAEARHSLRARENILWVFVMPAVFFYFIGTVTGGMGRSAAGPAKPRLGLVEPSGSDALTARIVRRLSQQGFDVVRGVQAATQGRRLELPPAFGESVAAGRGVEVIFVSGDGGLAGQYHRIRVARAVYTVLADVVVTRQDGQPLEADAFERLDAMPRNVTLSVRSAGQRLRIPTGFEQTIPGTTVMFTMIILLTGGSIPLVVERRQGLLRRLASCPIPRGAIVLGKWAGKMVLATVQIGFAMFIGTVLFRMDWGRALPMVAVVLLSWAAFNASLAMLLGSLARTEAQAAGIGVVFSMGLAALGGCWWPVEITAGWMQRLALFLPTGWAMDAMHQLVSFGASASTAIPHVLGLAAASLLIGLLSARSFRFA
jgi:ABC-2 type transport system permease protein